MALPRSGDTSEVAGDDMPQDAEFDPNLVFYEAKRDISQETPTSSSSSIHQIQRPFQFTDEFERR